VYIYQTAGVFSQTAVVRNPKTKFRSPSSDRAFNAKSLITPPHIAAHLQGTQNPPHKSQPCKRVAIANAQQTVVQFGETKNKHIQVSAINKSLAF